MHHLKNLTNLVQLNRVRQLGQVSLIVSTTRASTWGKVAFTREVTNEKTMNHAGGGVTHVLLPLLRASDTQEASTTHEDIRRNGRRKRSDVKVQLIAGVKSLLVGHWLLQL